MTRSFPLVLRLIGAGLLAAPLLLPIVAAAQDLSPNGHWRVTSGEAEFEARLCGADGSALCATLTALSNDASTPETTPYLGSELVSEAVQVAPNTWAGLVMVQGQALTGTAMMTDADTMEVAGCLYLVACRSFTLTRR